MKHPWALLLIIPVLVVSASAFTDRPATLPADPVAPDPEPSSADPFSANPFGTLPFGTLPPPPALGPSAGAAGPILTAFSALGATAPSAAGSAPADVSAGARAMAAYHFSLARSAMIDGDFHLALESFAEAVDLDPNSPYLRLEYGRLLVRLRHFSPTTEERQRRITLARQQADLARRLAGEEPDLLRELGQVYLELSEEDAEALGLARQLFERVREITPEDPRVLIQLGQIYETAGENHRAVEALREAILSVPGNEWAEAQLRRALVRLAQEVLQAGDSAAGEELLEEILGLDPDHPEARLTLANLQSNRGDREAALATLRGAGEAAENPEVRQRLLLELFLAGRLDEGATLARELVAADDSGDEVRPLAVLVLASAEKAGEAVDLLEEILADEPENEGLGSTLAIELAQQGRVDAGIGLLEEIGRRAGDEGGGREEVQVALAQVNGIGERWQAAADILEPLVRPERPALLLLYSQILEELGRADEALELLPAGGPPPLTVRRAELLFVLERPAEARQLVERLAATGDEDSLLQAGRVYLRQELWAEAVPLLEQLAELGTDSIEASYSLGMAYERSGRVEPAEEVFKALVGREPEFAPALNYLAYMWAERAVNLQQALELIRRAVALDPDNGAYVDSLGWVYYQLGRYEDALVQLERAAQLIPDDATILEHLGDAYAALGDAEQARRSYRQCLHLEDENADAVRAKLARLESGGS